MALHTPESAADVSPQRAGGTLAVLLAVMATYGAGVNGTVSANHVHAASATAAPDREDPQNRPELGTARVQELIQNFGNKDDPKKCDDAMKLLEKHMDYQTFRLLARARGDENSNVREKSSALVEKYFKQFYESHGLRYAPQLPPECGGKWPWLYLPPHFRLPERFKMFQGQGYRDPGSFLQDSQKRGISREASNYETWSDANREFILGGKGLLAGHFRASLEKQEHDTYMRAQQKNLSTLLQLQHKAEQNYRNPPPLQWAPGGLQLQEQGIQNKLFDHNAKYQTVIQRHGMM